MGKILELQIFWLRIYLIDNITVGKSLKCYYDKIRIVLFKAVLKRCN